MKLPQMILLVLMGLSLLASANLHGKERKPHNFWMDFLSFFISLLLLLWGGFFN